MCTQVWFWRKLIKSFGVDFIQGTSCKSKQATITEEMVVEVFNPKGFNKESIGTKSSWTTMVAKKNTPVLALLVPAPGPWPLLSIVSHLSGNRQNCVTSWRKLQKIKALGAKTMRRAVVQQRGRRTYLPQHFHSREDEVETWGSTVWCLGKLGFSGKG